MVIIPPGVDIARFRPPDRQAVDAPVINQLRRFLHQPQRPPIIAIARADERKNLANLLRSYAASATLQATANLIIVAGNRDKLRQMDRGAREVITELLLLLDEFDLWGKVALPKHHLREDVPILLRWAASRRGIFVNPALTEPFGLTLIEAAASGLPIVATHDGGPKEIIDHCRNGLLIDPLDLSSITAAMEQALADGNQWRRWSRQGVEGANRHYSWSGHAATWVKRVMPLLRRDSQQRSRRPLPRSRLPMVDRLLVCDIDNTLLGDREGLQRLLELWRQHATRVGFVIATGRTLESALKILRQWGVPPPDLLITAVGSQIWLGHDLSLDQGWQHHINHDWQPEALRKVMATFEGIELQPASEQLPFKISYHIDPRRAPTLAQIRAQLRRHDLHCKVIYSHQQFLDLLPVRASKGLAIRYLALRWGIEIGKLLVAGDSGNDIEMLRGETLGVVVGNHSSELARLRGESRIYFAQQCYAAGVLEGIEHYQFFADTPQGDENAS
jgi:sucrose-phosphate synthase